MCRFWQVGSVAVWLLLCGQWSVLFFWKGQCRKLGLMDLGTTFLLKDGECRCRGGTLQCSCSCLSLVPGSRWCGGLCSSVGSASYLPLSSGFARVLEIFGNSEIEKVAFEVLYPGIFQSSSNSVILVGDRLKMQ